MTYDSIRFIETEATFSAFVRGLHHWGASAMVVAIGLHILQYFLYGAYKPPREVMWMVGVVFFLIVIFPLLGISPENFYAVPRRDPALARGGARSSISLAASAVIAFTVKEARSDRICHTLATSDQSVNGI
jgi:hypothetical protein